MISVVLAMVGVSTRSGTAMVTMTVPTVPMRRVVVSNWSIFTFCLCKDKSFCCNK